MVLVKSIKNLSATTRTVGGQTFAQNVSVTPPVNWWITTSYALLHEFGQIEYTMTDSSKVTALTTNDSTFDCCAQTHDFYVKYNDMFAGNTDGLSVLNSEGQWFQALGSDGLLLPQLMPPLAINDTFTVANQAAMLALTAQRGDVAVRTDTSETYILAVDAPGTLANWKLVKSPIDGIQTVNGYSTPSVTLTKADMGLANAENTSDANKPISTATQTALNTKVSKAGDTMTGALTVTNPGGGENNIINLQHANANAAHYISRGDGYLGWIGQVASGATRRFTFESSPSSGGRNFGLSITNAVGSPVSIWTATDTAFSINAPTNLAKTLSIPLGTLTASKQAIDISATWNNGATAFTAPFLMNIVDAASLGNSSIFQINVGGTPAVRLSGGAGAGAAGTFWRVSGNGITTGYQVITSSANISLGTYSSGALQVTSGGLSVALNAQIGGALTGTSASFSGIVSASGGNSSDWNSAYAWGNHNFAGYAQASALSGYLSKTGGDMTGSIVMPPAVDIKYGTVADGDYVGQYYDTASDNLNFYNGTGGANLFTIGRTTGNGVFPGSVSALGGNSGNWNAAYSWGNHATAGYIGVNKNLTKPAIGQSGWLSKIRAANILGSNSAPIGIDYEVFTDSVGTHPRIMFVQDNANLYSFSAHRSLGLELPGVCRSEFVPGVTGDTLIYNFGTSRFLLGSPVPKNQRSLGTSALQTGTYNLDTSKEVHQLTMQLTGNLTISRGAMVEGETHKILIRGNTAGTSVVTFSVTGANIQAIGNTSNSGVSTLAMAVIPANRVVIYTLRCWASNFVSVEVM